MLKNTLLFFCTILIFTLVVAFSANAGSKVTGDLTVTGTVYLSDNSPLSSTYDLLRNKGPWAASTNYSAGDVVQSESSSYVCTTANTNAPPPNQAYWSVLASGTASITRTCTATQYISGINSDGSLICNYLPLSPVHSYSVSAATTPIGTSCTNYADGQITITVPAAGTISINSSAWLSLTHTSPLSDSVKVSIGLSPTDCSDGPGTNPLSLAANAPAGGYSFSAGPIYDYPVTTAGTYTFYLNGYISSVNPWNFYYARMSATWYPN